MLETLEDRRLLAVITVDTLSSDVVDDGMVSIVEAVTAANTDASVDGSVAGDGVDTIEFAPGLTGTITLSEALTIESEIVIDGPGSGEITIDGNQTDRIFYVPGGASSLTVTDIALTGGSAPDTGETRGGAIFFGSSGTLSLRDVNLTNHQSAGDGGAVFLGSGTLELLNSDLENNSSGAGGGSIATAAGTTATITSTVISLSQSVTGGGGLLSRGTTSVLSSVIDANVSTGDDSIGGGVANDGGDLAITNSSITANRLSGDFSYGGGVFSRDGNLTITSSTLSMNQTEGINSDGGAVTTDTNLDDQTASIVNSTLSGNTASSRAGAILNLDGLLVVRNSTITGNVASDNSGGIVSYADNNTSTEIESSIVTGNLLSGVGNDVELSIGVGGGFVSLGHNLIGFGAAAASFDAIGDQTGIDDAGLEPLANNGGPTLTHALLAGSPAVDAGNPSFDIDSLLNDQRGPGFSRVSGDTIDIGAFELGDGISRPSISAIEDQSIEIGQAIDELAFTITDAETSSELLTVLATSSDMTLVPDANLILGGTDADRTITVTPVAGVSGMSTITVTVTDEDGNSTIESFELTVSDSPNTAPTITAIDDQDAELNAIIPVIDFNVGDAESNADALVVTATSSNQALLSDTSIVLRGEDANRTLSLVPAVNQVGTTLITVTVADEEGLTTESSFLLTITGNPNTAPTITPISTQFSIVNQATSPVTFGVSDLESAPGTLVVSAESSNPDLLPSNNIFVSGIGEERTLTTTPLADQTGRTTITLTVEDEEGLQATTSFDLAVSVQPDPAQQQDHPTVLSELLISTVNGNSSREQYLELRGAPNEALAANTYIVVVSENNLDRGEVLNVFNLGGQTFGENGFLVLLQADSPHQPASGSRVIQSLTDGFAGLPGDIFSSDEVSDNQISTSQSRGIFLIEAGFEPDLDDDIDQNDDGLADVGGVFSTWNILDSVSLRPTGSTASQAYGQIVLAGGTAGASIEQSLVVAPGVEVVVAEGHGLASRFGASIGSAAADWITAEVVFVPQANNLPGFFEVSGRSSGFPEPAVVHSRDLDHVGEANFVGTIRGLVTNTALPSEANPTPDAVPVVGVTVFADTNSNGVQDNLAFVVDPDDAIAPFAPGPIQEVLLTNFFPNVTISSTFGTDNAPNGNQVRTAPQGAVTAASVNRIFSVNAASSFSNIERLRFDFYRPVGAVELNALGPNLGTLAAAGRIDAFRADGTLVGSDVSQLLVGNASQPLRIDSQFDDIAFLVAYADLDVAGSSDQARFDRLVYEQLEAADVTNDSGVYEIERLFPNNYVVQVLDDAVVDGQVGLDRQPAPITRFEEQVRNFNTRPNTPPLIEAGLTFNVSENAPDGSIIGMLAATDPDEQLLTFEIVDGADNGIGVNPVTGELTVTNDDLIDFETDSQLELTVSVFDTFATTTETVTVFVDDVNEPPSVMLTELSVAEGADDGTLIGGILAQDPESDPLTFEVIGGSGQNILGVDQQTGEITVIDGASIDFAANQLLTLVVQIRDGSPVSLDPVIEQTIEVFDLNDPPNITTEILSINENTSGVVGQIEVSDRDTQQAHSFIAIGGSGLERFELLIDGTLRVRDGMVVDFEQESTYTLEVLASDFGAPPLSDQATITINILDVNEAPVFEQTIASVEENSPAETFVAELVPIDPEGTVSEYEIELLPDADAADFVFDAERNELIVAEGADLNFETNPVRLLKFEVTDPGGQDPVAELTFEVNLLDNNDAPRVITDQVIVSELATPGTAVGLVEVQIFDPDLGDNVTVAIVGGTAADDFVIDPVTRLLTVSEGATFDADRGDPPGTILIEVTDSEGLSDTGEIEVLLNEVNERPVILTPPPAVTNLESGEFYQLTIPEDAIFDPESNPISIAFFDETGELPDWLSFDAATRTLSGLPDLTSVGAVNLTLTVFDPGPFELRTEVGFTLVVEPGSAPLTNQLDPLDVSANGQVSAIDALQVVNFIARNGSGASAGGAFEFQGFVDVNRDGRVTAQDALLVINGIAERAAGGAEGEQVLLASVADDEDDSRHDEALNQWLEESRLF